LVTRGNVSLRKRICIGPVDRAFDFDFGEKTAAVFDDMLNRSVPFYDEIQRMIGEISSDFACNGSQIFDLGCSICNSFLAIDQFLLSDINMRFVGIDSSEDMLEKARQKLTNVKFAHDYELRLSNLDKDSHIKNALVVLMILTLQFIRPDLTLNYVPTLIRELSTCSVVYCWS